jgi:hypothetical protein
VLTFVVAILLSTLADESGVAYDHRFTFNLTGFDQLETTTSVSQAHEEDAGWKKNRWSKELVVANTRELALLFETAKMDFTIESKSSTFTPGLW